MVAMVVPVESLSRYTFFLEADLLIDLDGPVIIGHYSQSESMEPSLLRELDRSLHHHSPQPDILKVLMDIDEHLPDSLAAFKRDSEELQVSNNSLRSEEHTSELQSRFD